MTLDLEIGFRTKPEGLTDFLAKEGYELNNHEEGYDCYENRDTGWPYLSYSSSPLPSEEESDPNWEKADFDVVAELNIHYHTKSNIMIEAKRISEALVKEFDAVLFDPSNDEYTTKAELG